jgi:hypothetical protein
MHVIAAAVLRLADIPWFWFVVIWLVWLVFSIVGRIRRSASLDVKQAEFDADKAAQQAEYSPQGQRLLRSVQTIAAQAQGAPAAVQTLVTGVQDAVANVPATGAQTPAQYGAAVVKDLSALRSPQARSALAGDLATLVQGIADRGAAAAAGASTMATARLSTMAAAAADTTVLFPSTTSLASGVVSGRFAPLHTPQGLANAIVLAAIIGPPQGLRSEPMQPGGW